MDLEQGPRGWAKGRVHAGSSEANSAHPRRPWGPGTAESGSLLGGDRHHAAGAGTAQSDCQGRGACQWHDSTNYRGRTYQEKATGPMRLVQGDGKGTWKVDCRVRQETRRFYFPRSWRAAASSRDDPAKETSAPIMGWRGRGSAPRNTHTNSFSAKTAPTPL